MTRDLFASILLLAAPSGAFARSSGAAFLKIPIDARALALGAGAAPLCEGAWALTSNPAGIGVGGLKETALLYGPHLQGTSLGFAAYAHPTALGTLGAGLLALRTGEMEGRSEQGAPAGAFTAEDRAFLLSFARGLEGGGAHAGSRIGTTFKVIQSRIASYHASGFALDIGGQTPIPGAPLRLGLSLQNLGPGLVFLAGRDPLPLNFSAGVSARTAGALTLTAGLRRGLVEHRTEFGLGAELELGSGLPGGWRLLLRGGLGLAGGSRSDAVPPALPVGGVGLQQGRVQLDYAFLPLGELGSMQRVGLTVRFGARIEDNLPVRHGRRTRGNGDFVQRWWRTAAPQLEIAK